VALCLLLRVIADTSSSAGWVRWVTPLGWAEDRRPFTGARPLVLLAPVAASALLVGAAARIAARRDIGTGLLASRDRPGAGWALPSSSARPGVARRGRQPARVGHRGRHPALVNGGVSKSVSSLGISKQLEHTLGKPGAGPALAAGAAGQQAQAAGRAPRAGGGRCGRDLSLCRFCPHGRPTSQGVSLSLPRMLEADINCLPATVLFLGIGALTYAAVPRASADIAHGLPVLASSVAVRVAARRAEMARPYTRSPTSAPSERWPSSRPRPWSWWRSGWWRRSSRSRCLSGAI